MSRLIEAVKQPDWYSLALPEVAKIPEFKGHKENVAIIIAKILLEAKDIKPEEGEDEIKLLRSPHKTLKLTMHYDFPAHAPENIVHGYIRNIVDDEAKGETTILFTAAKILMQAIANRMQEPLLYEFMAHKSPKMSAWADTNGKILFGWEPQKYEVLFTPSPQLADKP